MRAASNIETTLKIFEYKKITVPAGSNTSVMVNVNNDTGGSIYYGVFYEMVSPSTKTDDIGIYKIDWSENATSGSITNGSVLPVELLVINNSSSDITLNIGVAGSDSNELGLTDGKTLITETFNTGTEPSGDAGETKTTTTDYSYTGSVQTVTLKAGTHKLEVWGAQGGSYNTSYYGGKGGYSYGTLTLTEDTTAYINIGGQGGSVSSSTTGGTGGNNGGGTGGNGSSSSKGIAGSGGGGATDIRLNQDSLYARVIVAGGGGGAGGAGQSGGSSLAESTASIGGIGGGTSGIMGNNSGQSTYGGKAGGAGTATTAGTAGSVSTSTTSSTDNTYCAGGGGGAGGGWYGGGGGGGGSLTQSSQRGTAGNSGSFGIGGKGGASYSSCATAYYGSGGGSGGGGSGYVYTSNTATSYPSGCLLNSSYYLTDASTIAGNTSFTDNSGSTVTGHSGNGYARITSTVKASTIPSIDTSVIKVAEGDNVDLKSQVTCKDNGAGCKIVLVKPATTAGLTKSTNAVYVLEDNVGNRYKYYVSINFIQSAAKAIMLQSKGYGWEANAEDGLYATNSYTASDGTTKYHEYRYIGADPNNYVWFNNDMYQIIGVFDDNSHGKAGEYLVKLIMANPIGAYTWGIYNTSNNSGIYSNYANDWTGKSKTSPSNLNVLLNEYFVNKSRSSTIYNDCSNWTYYYRYDAAKTNDCSDIVGYGLNSSSSKSIENVTWFLYGNGKSTSSSKQNWYLCERGGNSCTSAGSNTYSTSMDAKIGLMYFSDYLYASSGFSSDDSTRISSNSKYAVDNWLYKGFEYTITPFGSNYSDVKQIDDGGYAGWAMLYTSFEAVMIRPVFYLKSSVEINGGSGTFEDPYTLG